MADAAVEFTLANLTDLMVGHAELMKVFRSEMEMLEYNLGVFKYFLKDLTKQEREEEMVKELILQIHNAVNQIDDFIDPYVIQKAQPYKKLSFHGAIQAPPKTVNAIVDEVKTIIEKIERLHRNGIAIGRTNVENESMGGQVKEGNVVGLEQEEAILTKCLFEESQELDVISIVGMGGLGKTTLAKKIFDNPDIRSKFHKRIWVYVSQVFTQKEIFLGILEEFTMLTDDIKSKTDQVLADMVVGYLENGSFLLVMDDLWSCDDWDKLRVALPKSNTKGKILITTRNREVGRYVNHHRWPHAVRFLCEDECLTLLQYEFFRDLKIPHELEDVKRRIVWSCGGHPLSVVLIGGILLKEFSSDITAMQKAWEDVLEKLTIFKTDEPMDEKIGSIIRLSMDEKIGSIIRLSYEKLPHRLKECFLYFGMFPEDFEIPAWKLIRMWIAEGFIQQKNDASSLEETAENYLEELIVRRLVRAEKFKLDGKVKTCRIHDFLRDFCLAEAGIEKEGFLQEIRKMSSDGGFQPPVSEELKFRRLCIHSNVLSFVSEKPYGSIVRSFICSSREEISVPMEDISAIPRGFKLLRVLDVEPIKFIDKLPRDLFQLLHLKYLVLSVNIGVLPAAFSQLRNMQTLVFETNSRTLEIRADVLKLNELRHFKTNASAALPETTTNSYQSGGEKIHTLGTLSPESCTKYVFRALRNLKTLGVRGILALLLDGKHESCGSLGNLENLEKLKLLNDVFPVPAWGGQLCGLPPPSQFPPKLKVLTLSRTSLDWSHMSIIGSLERLEVLKLKDKAFVGEIWKVADGGFRRLRVLLIERTNLKTWLASHLHFPTLEHLQLKHCDELRQVPIELADVPSFLKLELVHSKRAAASAKKIEKKKSGFKLSILPQWNDQASS